jgi:hypothetical protein
MIDDRGTRQGFQARFMRLPLEKQLGNIATNLNRIAAYSGSGSSEAGILFFVRETIEMTTWALNTTESSMQTTLLELQELLAMWDDEWHGIWVDEKRKPQMQAQALAWSERLLEMAGLK